MATAPVEPSPASVRWELPQAAPVLRTAGGLAGMLTAFRYVEQHSGSRSAGLLERITWDVAQRVVARSPLDAVRSQEVGRSLTGEEIWRSLGRTEPAAALLAAVTPLLLHLGRSGASAQPLIAAFLAGTGGEHLSGAIDRLFLAVSDCLAGIDPVHRLADLESESNSDVDRRLDHLVRRVGLVVRQHETFEAAVTASMAAAGADDATVAAAVAGLLAGTGMTIGAIPAAWTARLAVPEGQPASAATYLCTTAAALDFVPSEPLGPRTVLPGLQLANLRSALGSDPSLALFSLCRLDVAAQHAEHLEFVLSDDPRRLVNPLLPTVLNDALTSAEARLAAGRTVLVHCQNGKSRTGLFLRAWLMWRRGLDEPTATAAASRLWPATSMWNELFTATLAEHRFPPHRYALPGHDDRSSSTGRFR
jgi:hypothetical protein